MRMFDSMRHMVYILVRVTILFQPMSGLLRSIHLYHHNILAIKKYDLRTNAFSIEIDKLILFGNWILLFLCDEYSPFEKSHTACIF